MESHTCLLSARERTPHGQIYKRGTPLAEGSRFAVVKERNYIGQFLTEANWQKLDALTAFAQTRGLTILDVAMSWIAARPQVASVIAGATKPSRSRRM
jgi:aryl-alcohol dehydrogenase-like predicted oxidoreductase